MRAAGQDAAQSVFRGAPSKFEAISEFAAWRRSGANSHRVGRANTKIKKSHALAWKKPF
jgi:hypothetical protein